MDAHARKARSRLANAAKSARRHDSADAAAEVRNAKRDYAAAALAEHIRRLVADAPPLTDQQRDYLRQLLAPYPAIPGQARNHRCGATESRD